MFNSVQEYRKDESDKTLMVVDDDRVFVTLVSEFFKDYSVITAYDGDSAVERVKDFKEEHDSLPGLMLLDVNLLRVNGDEVCKRLKSDPEYSRMPIYFYSSKPSGELADLTEEAGADGYFSKFEDIHYVVEKVSKEF